MQIVFFIIGFFAFLIGFGSLIAFSMRKMNGKIDRRLHSVLEMSLIAGILLGIIGLFQPWSLWAYGVGFHLLLICVLGFTLWSHIMPRLRKA